MTTIQVREMQSDEGGRGNLAGHEVRCSCGYSESTTMASQVATMVHQHHEWHAKKATKRGRRSAA
jgi:hypothetical protein